jgi:hypothetical protein
MKGKAELVTSGPALRPRATATSPATHQNLPSPAVGAELAEFLRARRALVPPALAGLPDGGDRRVPGLRRTEVAALAGVSTDYYTRLEQGRERHPSDQVLIALARALCLDDDGIDHLFRLARTSSALPRRTPSRPSWALIELMNKLVDIPCCMVNLAFDLLAMNNAAEALYSDFSRCDNLMTMAFLDPVARTFYRQWNVAARHGVANIRALSGRFPRNTRLQALISELLDTSPDFARMWHTHDVRPRSSEVKQLHHSAVGDLTLRYESLTVTGSPELQLFTYQPEPGSPSEALLARLLSRPGPG